MITYNFIQYRFKISIIKKDEEILKSNFIDLTDSELLNNAASIKSVRNPNYFIYLNIDKHEEKQTVEQFKKQFPEPKPGETFCAVQQQFKKYNGYE